MNMTELWDRLERQLKIRAPELAASLRPGVSEFALTVFEEEIRQRLPDDVREAYLRHDGCDHKWDENAAGLFSDTQWLPLNEVREAWQWNSGGFDEADPYFYEVDDGGWEKLPVRPWQYPPPQWIPIGKRMGIACLLYVDMLPGPVGTASQLVCQDFSSVSTSVLCRGFAEYLQYLVTGLEIGDIQVDTVPHTQLRRWHRTDGSFFSPPGNASVFG